MPEYSSFPSFYDPSSVRAIVTPSAFARQNLFFLQEAGHIRLLESHAGTQRSSLDSFLIVQVAAGSGRLQYDGKTWPLQAGQCFWVDCRRPHGYRSADDDPWELRWVHFNGRSAPAFYGLFAAGPGPVFTPADTGAPARRLDAVLDLARHWDATAELEASAEIAALLAGILAARARGGQIYVETCPQYLLMDEAFAALDARYRSRLAVWLRGHLAGGGAVLWCSHEPSELTDLCDQAMVLDRGEVACCAPAAEALAWLETEGRMPAGAR